MIKLHGTRDNFALFTDSESQRGVVVDLDTNMVDDVAEFALLASSGPWQTGQVAVEKSSFDLAAGALGDLRVQLVASAGRMYTIPDSVKAEAKRALEWRKEHKRGGTPVGLNTARTLAKGGQIGIRKVRHIAKYFPRHEVDKKGKGYKPGQDGYPSAGRIAWALWGGDAGWRWARTIVERENKKAMRADGYVVSTGYDEYEDYRMSTELSGDISAFKAAKELGDEFGPEFVARVRLDGSGIDRVYKVENDGNVYVWDDGAWDDLGTVDGDIIAYDKALDDPYDTVEKQHVLLDVDSAMIICARLQQSPFSVVSVDDLDEEETALVLAAAEEVDWDDVDMAMTAAGEEPIESTDDTPGVYTPEERSEKARKQVRDKSGRFAAMGTRVVVGGNYDTGRGRITGINPDNDTVTVELDSGSSVTVPGAQTEREDTTRQAVAQESNEPFEGLDVSGILGQPRAPIDRPEARIPGALPALTPGELRKVMYDYPAWVKEQRERQQAERFETPTPTKPVGDYGKTPKKSEYQKKLEKESGRNLVTDAREHPMLKDFFKRKKDSALYYSPITSAGDEKKYEEPYEKGKALTPETSDVQPMYLAIVSPDDPRAVFDLVSIVPKSTTMPTPMTFKRVNGKWEQDPQILQDLTSATPPPVIALDADAYKDVLEQVDGAVLASAEFAQGGLDKNRGNAERLRRYWVYGKGALKIKWGAPGDWKRCVRHLSKYMGPRAKGYCNLRHKDALKIWPATHAKLLRGGRKRNSVEEFALADLVDHEDVFMMEEPIYGTHPTRKKPKLVVTEDDLKLSLEEINAEYDPDYDASWEPDEEILGIIEELGELVDDESLLASALVAKGGLDRNRGNAEKLRRYWLYGRGALKIRWNTPGDWTRCVRQLSKYMGPRAKGYCALRHKEATGLWTGDRLHRKMHGGDRNKAFSTDDIVSSEEYIERSILSAKADDAKLRVLTAGGVKAGHGGSFYIPLVIPEDAESGDGRKFKPGAIGIRELPLPLLWQIKTGEGHNGSVVVGRIDRMERVDGGIGNAYGVFDSGPFGREAERMVRHGFLRGVSADLDQFEADAKKSENAEDREGKIGGDKIEISKARVMAVTIVPKPAFEQCKILMQEDSVNELQVPEEDTVIPDGEYIEETDMFATESLLACGTIASAIPVTPPAAWFTNPKLTGPTPLSVDDNGRVFGHIAAWHVDHIGMTAGTKPPRSKSGYAYFHTGVVRADDGKDYQVGQLTLAGGHAPLEASARDAVKHYDDTASAIADVHAGEDQFGIWVAGALRPGTTPEQVRALRASAPSGDWRPIRGSLELVAVCQVNVPGFPIARARVAGGQVYALVAAGAAVLAKMKTDPVTELNQRLAKLEKIALGELELSAAEAKAKVAAAKAELSAQLAAKAEEAAARVASTVGYDEAGYMPMTKRRKLAQEGKALPDGSYPIRNVEELKNAIQAYGRGKPSKRAAIRRHIMKRARGLKRADLIPDKWKEASIFIDDEDVSTDDLRARIASVKPLAEYADISQRVRERLAQEGKAMPDGAYPIRNVSDLKNAIQAYGRAKESERTEVRKHIVKRARGLGRQDLIPENWPEAPESAEE